MSRDCPKCTPVGILSSGSPGPSPPSFSSNPCLMLRGALAVLALGLVAAWVWSRGFDPRWWLWQTHYRERVLNAAELRRYTGGVGSAGLYLAVLGRVFDVQRGRKHYGPGGAYSFFAGIPL